MRYNLGFLSKLRQCILTFAQLVENMLLLDTHIFLEPVEKLVLEYYLQWIWSWSYMIILKH